MANDRPRAIPSLKATISYDQKSLPARGSVKAALAYDGTAPGVPLASTVAAPSTGVHSPFSVAKTVAADSGSAPSASASPLTTTAARTTVLPRITEGGEVAWSTDGTPRYEQLNALGEGGVGEVLLARDRDIERRVAIKRLRADQRSTTSLLRFADEVRAVGQLEHPNIVPVHDVGIDETGQHYLVMKYVQGETLESIIEHLAAGDPSYVARFPHEHRARIFLSILQALRYAHGRGIIHRDIKPANIMVGPHGEVTVMDWGLAKGVRRDGAPVDAAAKAGVQTPEAAAPQSRLLETQQGALLGTPLYMSPEQAMGKVDELDERSDVYSLMVLFYELITLEHPLAGLQSLEQVLSAVISKDYTRPELLTVALRVDAPCEYYHYMVKGLARDPSQRYASVEEMERVLEAILDGKPPINCHITFTKRVGAGFLHWMERHKYAFTVLFLAAVVGAIWSVVGLVRGLIGGA
jgi:eukaryotic-like serine/threonine-protein kinase